jgi:hypothetical protein
MRGPIESPRFRHIALRFRHIAPRFRHVLALGIVLFGLVGWQQSRADAKRPDFKISVSPKEGSEGDTFTVIVEIDLPGLTGPDRYWPPDTSQFKILDSQVKRGTQSSIDPSAGQELRTVEVYRYVLSPTTTGRLLVGPAKIRIAGEEWETKQVAVRVRVGGAAAPSTTGIGYTDASGLGAPGYTPPTGKRPDVFLYAVADKSSVWVGEQITVSWLLFARTEILKYEPTPPRLAGLWSEVLFEPASFFKYTDARIGDLDYVVAMVSKRAFFASKSGKLVIDPLQAKIATVSTALGRQESIASNSLQLTVKGLPQPAPKGFDKSYVGKFRIATTVDRDLLQAGQPLTLSVRVRGQGAIAQMTAPRLKFPGFVFEEPRDFEFVAKHEGDVIGGERLYRYWTTPSLGGEQTIPAIELPYFDPSSGSYEVARGSAIGITVEGDPDASSSANQLRGEGRAIARDIRLLRPAANLDSRVLVSLHREAWFWWLLCIPPFGFVAAILGDRFRRRLRKETPRARLRRAQGKARSHLKVAEIHLRGQRPAKFFASLSHAVYGHLEEWLDHGLQSMTQKEMRSFLAERGMDAGTIRRIEEDLDTFDRARFAPSATDIKEMRAAVERTKNLLQRVEGIEVHSDEPGEEGA